MKKNVSGQKVGAQMVAADGTAFTGSVTVSVTLDAGTQAAGSVGSGACTHEGNGYHTYAPAQAETNGDLAAFTFTGTGAVPQTIQIYTSFPQTGDAYAKGVDVETDTQDIQSRLPASLSGGRMDSVANAMGNNVMTAAAAAADLTTELQAGLATASALSTLDGKADAIKAKTDNLPSDPADQSLIIAATDALATLIGTVDAVVDGIKATTDQLPDGGALTSIATAAALATVDGVVDAVKAKTDSLTFSVAGQVDANIQYVNDVQVQGDGQPGTEWGP